MGKDRRKHKFQRPCPTGLSDADLTDEPSTSFVGSQEGALLGSLAKLQSHVPSDRECGAEGLALVACSKEAIDQLLQQNVVRIAAPLLLDASPSIRHSIAGSLRNLTAIGGHTVCEHFVEKDVLTPLVQLFKRFYQDWKPAGTKEGAIDSSTETFIEATHLLLNLCESSELAITKFNSENLLDIFLPCLDFSIFGAKVTLAAAQCLHAATESNPELWSHHPPDCLKDSITNLLAILGNEPNKNYIRALAAGIYLNMQGGKLVGSPMNESVLVLETIASILNETPSNSIKSFITRQEETMNEDKPVEELMKGVKSDLEKSTKEDAMTILSAKQICLEVLANACCDDEGADEWDSTSSSETGEEIMEIPMEEDSPGQDNLLSLPCEIQEAVTTMNLVQRVEEHAFVPLETLSQLAAVGRTQDLIEKLVTMQCSALLCLNNLVGGLDLVGEEKADQHLQELWTKLAQLMFSAAENSHSTLLEASSSSLRATVQRLAQEKFSFPIAKLTSNDLASLYKVAQECPDVKVRVNVLRVVSTIGILLGYEYTTECQPFLMSIGQFLIELSLKDKEILVNAEAADAIIDVFSEDHTDPVAKQIMLVQSCRQIHQTIKSKSSQRKKSPGEHLPMVAMVRSNLLRFIKYKSKQIANGAGQ